MASRKKASSKNGKRAAKKNQSSTQVSKTKAQGSNVSCSSANGTRVLESNGNLNGVAKKKVNSAVNTPKTSPILQNGNTTAQKSCEKSPTPEVGKSEPSQENVDAKVDLRTRWTRMMNLQGDILRQLSKQHDGASTYLLFDQDQPCNSACYNLGRSRCVECINVPSKLTESSAVNRQQKTNTFCRFISFRKLTFTDKGVAVATDKFRDSLDAKPEDIDVWSPVDCSSFNQPTTGTTAETKTTASTSASSRRSRYETKVNSQSAAQFNHTDASHIIAHASYEFFRLVALEMRTLFLDDVAKRRQPTDGVTDTLFMSDDYRKSISFRCFLERMLGDAAWRTLVSECRELCDICATSLFNVHWICIRCGLVACVLCFRSRLARALREQASATDSNIPAVAKGANSAINNENGAGDASSVDDSSNTSAAAKKRKSVSHFTTKRRSKNLKLEDKDKESESESQTMETVTNAGPFEHAWPLCALTKRPHTVESLRIAQLAPKNAVWLLARLLFDEAERINVPCAKEFKRKRASELSESSDEDLMFVDFLLSFAECEVRDGETNEAALPNSSLIPLASSKSPELPLCITALRADRNFEWLCEGRMLHIRDSHSHPEASFLAFRHFWKLARPILVSRCDRNSDSKLWHPDSFISDFGTHKCELYDCETNELLRNQEMRTFWIGFEDHESRLKRPLLPGETCSNKTGEKMRILKLKDWPPYDSIESVIPSRWTNMQLCLPLPEYTMRTGRLNLASRLPAFFGRPDLGPKMYNAYGSTAARSHAGSTNLHVDISDAVNLLMYVGRPTASELQTVSEYLNDIGLADDMRSRLQLSGAASNGRRTDDSPRLPGALWHIFESRDSPKIREYLRRQTIMPLNLGVSDDPIHDQLIYVDERMLRELRDQYGVEAYTIVQCVGDAVFIPAGAAHQVKNLLACVKIASDFVSAENVSECVRLTDQFRRLSKRHANHEDKLQIRNMLYHALKDSVSVMPPSSSS